MSDRPRIVHQPGLDGLRGLAVAGVLLFHAGFGWARGGFLGVSTFFTLSGFLITALLLAERDATGRIDLRAFWARRARRLMPAALLALAGVAVYARFGADAGQLSDLRGDVLAALGYVANWRFIVDGTSYSELFSAPSPVQHFWSLAIEEQFYVLFPLAAAGLLAVGRGSRRPLATVLAVAAGASIVAMAASHVPGADTARAYYGTDTRAAELLVGALLALWMGRKGRAVPGRRRLAVALPAGVVLASVIAAWARVPQDDARLYQGGFALHALATALLVAAAQEPGPVRALLSVRPLRALGRLSYGAYLYHWPVFLWLDGTRTGLDPAPLFAVRIAATLALAVASYHLVEHPIRTGRAIRGLHVRLALPVAVTAVVALTAAATVDRPAPPVVLAAVADAPPPVAPQHRAASTDTAPDPAPSPGPSALATAEPDVPATTVPPAAPAKVMVVGDSVGNVVGRALERWGASTGEAVVWNVAIPGCGVGRGGELTLEGGQLLPSTPGCDSWAERWARQLREFSPDAVVVLTGTWDVVERRLPGWDVPRTIGDAAFDAWLLDEYLEASRVLGAGGARVTWLTAPCVTNERLDGVGIYDPERVRILHRLVTGPLAVRRPAMQVLDLNRRVCPDGAFTQRLGGLDGARPDGVHFSEPAADWVARWLGPQIVGR